MLKLKLFEIQTEYMGFDWLVEVTWRTSALTEEVFGDWLAVRAAYCLVFSCVGVETQFGKHSLYYISIKLHIFMSELLSIQWQIQRELQKETLKKFVIESNTHVKFSDLKQVAN